MAADDPTPRESIRYLGIGSDPRRSMRRSLFASLLCVYIAYLIIACLFVRILGLWPGMLATLMLFPGAYGLLFEPKRHQFEEPGMLYNLTPYSAINGMETPLSLVLWSIFFLTLLSRFYALAAEPCTVRDVKVFFPIATRICLAALVLARLDDVFLVVAIGLFVLFQTGYPLAKRIKDCVYIAYPTIIAVALYMAFNLATVGVLLPVSANAKMMFSASNNFHLLVDLFSNLTNDPRWWVLSVRMFPIIFSLMMGVASIYLGWSHRFIISDLSTGSLKFLLNIIGYFLILKGLFLLLGVNVMWAQGYWYYFSLVVLCNAILAVAVAYFVNRNSNSNILPCALFYSAILLFHLPNDMQFLNLVEQSKNYSNVAYALWNNEVPIRNFLQKNAPNAKMIESYDGMFVYLLDMPGKTFSRFASNPNELVKFNTQGFWQTVIPEGFSLVPDYRYVNIKSVSKIVRVVKVLSPPSSPVQFLQIELIKN